jgi:hypothetical protein
MNRGVHRLFCVCQVESLLPLTGKHPRGIDCRCIVLVQARALQQKLGLVLSKDADKSINPGPNFVARFATLDSRVTFPSIPILVGSFPSIVGSERVVFPRANVVIHADECIRVVIRMRTHGKQLVGAKGRQWSIQVMLVFEIRNLAHVEQRFADLWQLDTCRSVVPPPQCFKRHQKN